MTTGTPQAAQIVQTAGDFHNGIGQAFSGVAEWILDNATNFHSSDGVLNAHSCPGQMAIMQLLGRRQRVLLGLFFGCRCWRTRGA